MQAMHFMMKKPETKSQDAAYKIYLYDDIEEHGEFDWETWDYAESETSAKAFNAMLSEVPQDGEIELYINSNGGSVKEGTAIYNQLKRHPAHKTGIVDGVAHSIASVILQACDKRVMGEGTNMLIHEMWTMCMGNAKELRAIADQLDQMMEGSRALYMQRAKNLTEDELREMMEKETYLTPDKALYYGFIDEISGRKDSEDKGKAKGKENMLNNFEIKQFLDSVLKDEDEEEKPEEETDEEEPEEDTDKEESVEGNSEDEEADDEESDEESEDDKSDEDEEDEEDETRKEAKELLKNLIDSF